MHLTEKAVQKLIEISEAEGIENLTVRIKILGGGCAGFSYDMSFDETVNESDEVVEQDGCKLVCDPVSYQYLDECEIDWHDAMIGGGFKFINPKATGSCGCGNSVAF